MTLVDYDSRKVFKGPFVITVHVGLCLEQAMGLALVRHFSRLLPLLLEWVSATDVDTRLAALPVLHVVLQRTWPRMPAHAHLICQHLLQEHAQETQAAQRAGNKLHIHWSSHCLMRA